ncbi:hypothetical protein CH06BL_00250 [Chromobacterium haemolyticum]|nr:hypothetical protein CH06BL_00250 [Chromobacterium haemolyticum]
MLLLLVLSGIANHIHATCSATSSVTQPFPNEITVLRDAPNGTVLATARVKTEISCNSTGLKLGRGQDYSWKVHVSPSNQDHGKSSVSHVRNTKTEGIGIRWSNHNHNTSTSQVFSKGPLNKSDTNRRGIHYKKKTMLEDTFELIKTGNITSRVLAPMHYAMHYSAPPGGHIYNQPLYMYAFNPSAIKAIGCSFRNASQTVRLPDVSTLDFAGTGRAGDKQFNIDLDCAPGTSIRARLSDANARGNTGTLLSIAGGRNNAQGIGLELQRQGETGAYVLGTEFTSLAARQQHALPMVVRYAVNGAPIQPGEVNAAATVELSFD